MTEHHEHRASLARAAGSVDLREGRTILYTPHVCLDCSALVYVPHQTPRAKPWRRKDVVES